MSNHLSKAQRGVILTLLFIFAIAGTLFFLDDDAGAETETLPDDGVLQMIDSHANGILVRQKAERDAAEAAAHAAWHVEQDRIAALEAQREARQRVVQAVAAPKAAQATGTGKWDALAQCESEGRWNLNTGNGYYGGVQFSAATWRQAGGTGLPHQHSRETQIAIAESWLAKTSWSQWPFCSRKLGYR